ncbi:hypothetical protein K461DRAFT_281537 [Myriangium duriaei CBS 260.36]|uniref:Uncharacterized protein n=1 Tax=Myriangium duriaei CBS 260.36 TaxID=1168546 RepID=A0A9P4IT35_9PEZI|nr:hypothetical protein K461DRAFT_281537 [Myriangium duriaei CBS 260.36]
MGPRKRRRSPKLLDNGPSPGIAASTTTCGTAQDLELPRNPPTYLGLISEALEDCKQGLDAQQISDWVLAERAHLYPDRTAQVLRSGIQNALSVQGRASGSSRKLWMWMKDEGTGHKTKIWTLAGVDPVGLERCSALSTTPRGTSRATPRSILAEDGSPSATRNSCLSDNGLPPADAPREEVSVSSSPVPDDLDELQALAVARVYKRKVSHQSEVIRRLQGLVQGEIEQKQELVLELDSVRNEESGLEAEIAGLEHRMQELKQTRSVVSRRRHDMVTNLRVRLDMIAQRSTDLEKAQDEMKVLQTKLEDVLSVLGL